MNDVQSLRAAADLFKALGHESRLQLLRLVEDEPQSVGALAEAMGMSQPLVSQHLARLRRERLVAAERRGREVLYRLEDRHVAHVIGDAIAHAAEERPPSDTQHAEHCGADRRRKDA